MRFLKSFRWWVLFTIVWWGLATSIILRAPTNDGAGTFAMSTRQADQIFFGTYGLGAYIILSLVILVTSFLVYQKK